MEMNLLCSKKPFFNLLDVSSIDKRVGVAAKKKKNYLISYMWKNSSTASFLCCCFSCSMPISAPSVMEAEHDQRLTILKQDPYIKGHLN